jgi:hypothetical protein
MIGSQTFLATIACLKCTSRSTMRMDPPWPGCNSSMYVLLPNIWHLLYVFKTNVTIHLSVQVDYKADNAELGTVGRFLDVYLLWMFVFVMFCESAGDSVSKYLIPYTRMIAETSLDVVHRRTESASRPLSGFWWIEWQGD